MGNGVNRCQFRATGQRQILMKYVNKDRYFTKSRLKRTLYMGNVGNRGLLRATGQRLIFVKYMNKDRSSPSSVSNVHCIMEWWKQKAISRNVLEVDFDQWRE